MRLPKFSKKVMAIGAAAGIAMGAAGIAAAYFTSTGTGTGHGSVGSSTSWHFVSATTSTTAYPTAGQSYTTFGFTNTSHGKQAITSSGKVTPTVVTSGGFVENTSAATAVVATCKSKWFTVALTGTSWVGVSYAHGAGPTIKVKMTMNNGTGTTGSNQDACKNVTPKLHLAIAS